MKKLLGFAFCIAFLAGCASNQAVKSDEKKEAPKTEAVQAPAATPDVLKLFDFEDDKEIAGLYKENDDTRDYPIEKVTENATSGKYCIKISFPDKGSWPGPHFLEFPRDWSAYDSLKFDVFNPTKQVVKIAFAGADADAGFSKEAYFGQYAKRFGGERILKPGKNTVEFDLTGIVVEDGSRPVDFKKMQRFAIFMMDRPKGMVVYLDNIRCEKSKGEE